MPTKDESEPTVQIEEDLNALNERIAAEGAEATSADAMNPPPATAKKS